MNWIIVQVDEIDLLSSTVKQIPNSHAPLNLVLFASLSDSDAFTDVSHYRHQ